MRCVCCNKNLTDYESVLRHPVTMEFLDMCRKCIPFTDLVPVEPSHEVDDFEYDDIEQHFYNESESDDL